MFKKVGTAISRHQLVYPDPTYSYTGTITYTNVN